MSSRQQRRVTAGRAGQGRFGSGFPSFSMQQQSPFSTFFSTPPSNNVGMSRWNTNNNNAGVSMLGMNMPIGGIDTTIPTNPSTMPGMGMEMGMGGNMLMGLNFNSGMTTASMNPWGNGITTTTNIIKSVPPSTILPQPAYRKPKRQPRSGLASVTVPSLSQQQQLLLQNPALNISTGFAVGSSSVPQYDSIFNPVGAINPSPGWTHGNIDITMPSISTQTQAQASTAVSNPYSSVQQPFPQSWESTQTVNSIVSTSPYATNQTSNIGLTSTQPRARPNSRQPQTPQKRLRQHYQQLLQQQQQLSSPFFTTNDGSETIYPDGLPLQPTLIAGSDLGMIGYGTGGQGSLSTSTFDSRDHLRAIRIWTSDLAGIQNRVMIGGRWSVRTKGRGSTSTAGAVHPTSPKFAVEKQDLVFEILNLAVPKIIDLLTAIDTASETTKSSPTHKSHHHPSVSKRQSSFSTTSSSSSSTTTTTRTTPLTVLAAYHTLLLAYVSASNYCVNQLHCPLNRFRESYTVLVHYTNTIGHEMARTIGKGEITGHSNLSRAVIKLVEGIEGSCRAMTFGSPVRPVLADLKAVVGMTDKGWMD